MNDNVLIFHESIDLLEKVNSLCITKFELYDLVNNFKNDLNEITNTCKKLGLINTKNKFFVLTDNGRNIVSKTSDESKLNAFVRLYIDKLYPACADLIKTGRKKAAIFLPDHLRQILNETKIFLSLESYQEFSSSLKQSKFQYDDCRKKEIGTYGEKLSLKYEKKRVKEEPKWIAAEDDGAGYDLESFIHPFSEKILFIEVKTTTMAAEHGAIFISRNEWKTAETKWDSYLFHVWVIKESIVNPFIFSPNQIEKYIPKDSAGGWWCDVGIKVKSLLRNYKEFYKVKSEESRNR